MVLATVCYTEGSTYSKAGHRILIADNGDYQGLVSGGCLEGDLAEHADQVIADGVARVVTYDMRDDADELWGLGVGCNGLIRILLQRLDAATAYEPYATLANCIQGRDPAICATVIESRDDTIPVGATFVTDVDGARVLSFEIADRCQSTMLHECKKTRSGADTRLAVHCLTDGDLTVLYSRVPPLLRILVLGAGLDAIPLVNIADQLGWLVTIVDHRQAYLEKAQFDQRPHAFHREPEQLASSIELAQFSAAIVMSHHLATDRIYLRQLAPSRIPYVGVLGPPARRGRLVEDLTREGVDGLDRIRGPIGVDIGATCAESIALSILAEIYSQSNLARNETKIVIC